MKIEVIKKKVKVKEPVQQVKENKNVNVVEKYTQSIEQFPYSITNIPFYNDVYYSTSGIFGSPIYVQPDNQALENPSYIDNFESFEHFQPFVSSYPQQSLISQQDPFNIERDSYFNTINSTNKDVNYKDFKPKTKVIEQRIIYMDKNKDYVNMSIILLLIIILLLNY